MIVAHLPALQVVIPLLAAPTCVLLRNGRAAWLLFDLLLLDGAVGVANARRDRDAEED